MELKNVSRYLPDYMPYGNGVQYFKCERGQDFYESLDLFSKKYKLCIEPNTGIIRSIAEDASTLYPVDFSVIEVDELPDGVDILGGWMFDGEKIVPRVFSHDEMLNSAGSEKSRLMQDINAAITPLQDAKDLGIITEAEKLLLLAWKRYRVLLNRIDVSRAPDIEWPEPPVTR